MTNIAHNFQSMQISQNINDEVIGGYLIPAGYVNATQMCKVGGKKIGNWTRLNSSQAYIEAFSRSIGITIDRLIIKLSGTPDGDASLQGTWVHPEVATEIASWLKLPASDNLEKVCQEYYHKKFGGSIEVPTIFGKIDLLTETTLYEFKNTKNYKEALGQILCYRESVKVKRYVIVLFKSSNVKRIDYEFFDDFNRVCSKYGVTLEFFNG